MKPCLFAVGSLLFAAVLAAQPERAPDGVLVVVSPRELRPELEEYLAFKQARLPTEYFALEDVLVQSAGSDDPEKLKQFLYRFWKEEHTIGGRNLRYVLLVGDADVMPVRYMVLDRVTAPAFDYAFYPSDLYYGDLAKGDGSYEDWNGVKDGFHGGYFGEVRGEKNKADPINFDDISYTPEIAVGRWPASSAAQVKAIAAKTIAHELALEARRASLGGGGAAPRAAFVAIGGWIENRPMMDAIAARLGTPWVVKKLYFGDEGSATGGDRPDEAGVVAALNDGVDVVFHSGHGADDRWEGSIGVWSIPKMTNAARPAVMLSAGCSTARLATLPPYEAYVDAAGAEHAGTNAGEVFTEPPPPPRPYQSGAHNPSGLGEQLLLAPGSGAAAYFGCNTGSQPCGMTLLDGFADALGRDDCPRLGDCWMHAVKFYHERERLAELKPNDDWYPPSIFFQGMKFMLLGDPSIPMPGAWGAPGGGANP